MVQEYEREINLFELFKEIKRKIAIILACGIVFSGGFYVYSEISYEEVYEATATLYIETNMVDSNVLKSTESIPLDYIELIRSKSVLEHAIHNIGIEMEYEELLGMLSVTNTEKTYVLNVSINSTDQELAASLANAVSKAATENLNNISNVHNLRIISEASIPSNPIAKENDSKTVLLAFLFGVCVASIVVIWRLIAKNGFMSKDDAETYLKVRTIGQYKTGKGNDERYKEATFRYLCSNIGSIVGEFKCILTIAPTDKDESSEISKGMVDSLDSIGKKVSYIDMDIDCVREECRNFKGYKEELSILKEENDVVIINASSVEKNPNIIDIIDYCDGAILVIRKNMTNRKTVKHVKEQLDLMECDVIGVVLTEK